MSNPPARDPWIEHAADTMAPAADDDTTRDTLRAMAARLRAAGYVRIVPEWRPALDVPAPRPEQTTLPYGIRARESRRRAGLIPALLRRPNRKPLP